MLPKMSRREHVDRFYEIIRVLEGRVGGKKKLKNCHGKMNWPTRGVYIFFCPKENRENGEDLRVTRVGTHAVSSGSKRTLWDRLKTHQGTLKGKHAGGGNHRGSIFRLRVGEAIINKKRLHNKYPHWGKGSSASRETRDSEYEMEAEVSQYVRNLPFLWVKVTDDPSANSDRAYIERNAIALLSNYQKKPVDPRDENWLGQYSPKREIKESGLWNSKHVSESYDPNFLELLEKYVRTM